MMSASSPLSRIVYTSRRAAGTMHLDEAVLVEQILGVSRRKNASWRISGALVSGAGRFAQVLEGPPDLVAGMFDIIQQDERHHDVRLMHQGQATSRLFATWTMAHLSELDLVPDYLAATDGSMGLLLSLRGLVRGGPAAFSSTPFGAMAQAA